MVELVTVVVPPVVRCRRHRWVAELFAIVQFATVSVPPQSSRPPAVVAELSAMVVPLTAVVPMLSMPPPPSAELLSKVEFETVIVPP